MKLSFAVAVLSVVVAGGCLSSAPKAPVNWVIEPKATAVIPSAAAKWGVARLSTVSVRAPYDGQRLAVLRPNGSIAFDAYNVFAATPAALMRGAGRDILEASGLFARVLPAVSAAASSHAVEINVTRLALDCRTAGKRAAVCDVTVLLINGREVVGSSHGTGSVPLAEGVGDFSAAFSSSFTEALTAALKTL